MNIVPAAVWSREKWRTLTPMRRPVDRLWVHHGATGRPDLATLQAYDRYHVRHHGWAALGYCYAITTDAVYEGRGHHVGAHTSGDNDRSIGVVLVGNWTSATVPQPMVERLAALVRHLHGRGDLSRPVITGGHRQAPAASTTCPGGGGMDAIGRARRLLDTTSTSAMAPEDDMPAPKDWDDADVARVQAIVARTIIVGTDKHLSWHLRRIEALSALTAGRVADLDPMSDDQLDQLAEGLADALGKQDADRFVDRFAARLGR